MNQELNILETTDAPAASIGKSCFLLHFCGDSRYPPQEVTSTIGIDFDTRTIEIDDQRIRLHIVRVRKFFCLAKSR